MFPLGVPKGKKKKDQNKNRQTHKKTKPKQTKKPTNKQINKTPTTINQRVALQVHLPKYFLLQQPRSQRLPHT